MAIRVGDGVVRIAPDLGNFGALVSKDVTNAFDRIGRQAQNLGSAFLPLSLAMGGILAASANLAIQFEDDFVKIEALVGSTTEALARAKPAILDLAVSAGRGPTELSDALYFVESAGIQGAAALEVVDAAAKGAAVGLGDAATVADALTSAVNAYKQSGLGAEEATDVLVATVREGKIETDALGTVIGRVIPVAAQLGISFDQVGAAIASASKVGLNAEEATTALRQTLVTLIKPSAEARNVLEAYGLSADGLRRQIREEGLLATLHTLNNAFGDNQEALNRVFQNVRALTGVLSLVGENADQVQEVFDELAASTGSLNTAFEITQRSTRFQLDRALASLQATAISLGDTFLPIIRAIAENLAELAQSFANLPGPIKNFITTGLAVGALSAPLLLVVGSLIRTAGALAEVRQAQLLAAQATEAHAIAAGQLTGALAAQTGAATANAGGILGGGRLGNLLLGPKGSGTASVAGVIGKSAAVFFAGQILQTFVDTFKQEGDEAQNETVDSVNDFIGSISTGAALGLTAGSFLGPIGAGVGALAGGLGGALAEALKPAFEDAGKQAVEAIIVEWEGSNELQDGAREFGAATGISFARGFEDEVPEVGNAFASLLEEIKVRQKGFLSTFTGLATAQSNIFKDDFEDIPDLTFDAIAAITGANAAATNEIEATVSTLRERGLTGLATQLADNVGPEALAAARAIKTQLLEDPDSVFNLEADVQRLSGSLRDQFVNFLGEPATGGLPAGLFGRLDQQAQDSLQNSLSEFGALLGRERPELADQIATSFSGTVQDGIVNGIARAFAEFDPASVLPADELLSLLNDVFQGETFESLLNEALVATVGDSVEIDMGDLGVKIVDFGDLSFDDEQVLAKIARGIPLQAGPVLPLTIEEKIALSGADIDLAGLTATVSEQLTLFADENLPEILNSIDFARGDITFQEAVLTALTSEAAQITQEELASRLNLGETFGAAIVADIQEAGPIIGPDAMNQVLIELETARALADFKAPFVGIGRDIVDGIIVGILEKDGELQSAITGLMLDTEISAAEAAGAESPAKRYIALGKNIVDGLRIGIESSSVPDVPLPGVTQAAEFGSRFNQLVVNFNNPKHRDPVLDSERILGVLRTTELIS